MAWEECAGECGALLHNFVLQEHVNDRWKWLLDHTRGYSLRETYHFLTTSDEVLDRGCNHNVWHKLVPLKIPVFAWCLLRNRILTKIDLLRRGVLQHNNITCVGGCGCSETADHLFLVCNIFGDTWNFLWCCLNIDFVPSGVIGEHFAQFSQLVGMSRSSHSFFKLICLALVWVIWKERNNHIFKNVASDPGNLVDKVKLNSFG